MRLESRAEGTTYTAACKEKPMFHHAAIQASLALAFALFLSSGQSWDLMARTCVSILNFAGIRSSYVGPLLLIYLRLLDGAIVGFEVLAECSGVITMLVFAFVSSFTIGLLRGNLTAKLLWFILSIAVGFIWNISRLASVISIAYYFGLPAFLLAHYVLAPTVDFVWVVSLWALGMSWLKRRES